MLLLLLLCRVRIMVGIVTQKPYKDGCHEDNASHLFQVLLAFFPCMSADGLCRRKTVGWKLHHKRRVVTFDHKSTKQSAHHYGQQYADGIHGKKYQTLIMDKEYACNHYIYR